MRQHHSLRILLNSKQVSRRNKTRTACRARIIFYLLPRNSGSRFLPVMPCNFSRDSKSAAFAGAQPRAHPSFGVRALPKYAAKRRTETDNRREAAAEGRERGSGGQQAKEHISKIEISSSPLPWKAENGVQTDNRRGHLLPLPFPPPLRKPQSAAQAGNRRRSILLSSQRGSARRSM